MRVLCISVHPDDETLGCGGSLLKHKKSGDELHWLIVTKAFSPKWAKEVIKKKEKEVSSVASAYGMKTITNLELPATELIPSMSSQIIESVRDVIEKVKPTIVYTIHGGDVHSDHRLVFEAVNAVLKPFQMKKLGVKRFLSFETISSTEGGVQGVHAVFTPEIYSDISVYMERKLKVMRLYKTELQEDPMPRGPSAIMALARYRGSAIGVEYAESFKLIREIS